ncbi:hypothetical protein ACFVW1_09535 [Streptomyces olivochromogenes]
MSGLPAILKVHEGGEAVAAERRSEFLDHLKDQHGLAVPMC